MLVGRSTRLTSRSQATVDKGIWDLVLPLFDYIHNCFDVWVSFNGYSNNLWLSNVCIYDWLVIWVWNDCLMISLYLVDYSVFRLLEFALLCLKLEFCALYLSESHFWSYNIILILFLCLLAYSEVNESLYSLLIVWCFASRYRRYFGTISGTAVRVDIGTIPSEWRGMVFQRVLGSVNCLPSTGRVYF